MNKRDSTRILALGCHPMHTYSCFFALAGAAAAPRAPLPSSTPMLPSATLSLPLSLPPPVCTQLCTYRVQKAIAGRVYWQRTLSPRKHRGMPRKFMSNSRRYFAPLSHVRPRFLSSFSFSFFPSLFGFAETGHRVSGFSRGTIAASNKPQLYRRQLICARQQAC